jgi:hypothetical protein
VQKHGPALPPADTALADVVEAAEVELRASMALRRSQPIQPRSLHTVLRHALALSVEVAEAALRVRIALRRR